MKYILSLCLLCAIESAYAQTPVSPSAGALATTRRTSQSAAEKAVRATEKQRFEAQVTKNYAVLDRVLAPDLVYTYSHGGSDTKQSYIESLREGKSKYDSIDILEQNVRLYGNTAVINGKCLIKAMSNGETINTVLRYTDVYVRKGNQWQMVTWQSLKVP